MVDVVGTDTGQSDTGYSTGSGTGLVDTGSGYAAELPDTSDGYGYTTRTDPNTYQDVALDYVVDALDGELDLSEYDRHFSYT